MNTKQRYRERLKMRAALTRVLEVLDEVYGENRKGIEPDQTAVDMASRAALILADFVKMSGLLPRKGAPMEPFVRVKVERQKQTDKRARRHKK